LPLRTDGFPLATRNREIGIHIQSSVSRNRAIAADIRATRADSRATATRSRETGIYSREIASYIREIAADRQEMAANIEAIAGYTGRTAAPGLATIARRRFTSIYGQNASLLPFARCSRLHTLRS